MDLFPLLLDIFFNFDFFFFQELCHFIQISIGPDKNLGLFPVQICSRFVA